MAKVEFNSSLSQVHGMVDHWVYRKHYGQSVISSYQKREDRPTPAQTTHRLRFRDAQAYARSVLADPLKSLSYRRLAAARGCPPNALLVGNFFTPPAIEEVELSAYHGRAGDLIRVLATDTIEVVGVTVTVHGADAATLETGAATKDHDLWLYRSTTSPADPAGVKIEITARNRAGATVTASYPIS